MDWTPEEKDIQDRLDRIAKRVQQIADMEAKAAERRIGQPVPSPFSREKQALADRTDELLAQWEALNA